MSLLGIQRHGSGPLLVWLHGFTQTRDSAHEFRTILAGTFEVVTIDLPGHGENSRIGVSLDATADLLAQVLPVEPFILAGYSFGARVSLHFALSHPQRLRGLVLLGASRGIEDLQERAWRRQRDNELADRIERIGTDRFLQEWLAQPMFADLPNDPSERSARSRDPRGLATSLRLAGTGTQRWLGEELRTLNVPALALAGERDAKFAKEALALATSVPLGASGLISNAQHAAHLEQPEATASTIAAYHFQ